MFRRTSLLACVMLLGCPTEPKETPNPADDQAPVESAPPKTAAPGEVQVPPGDGPVAKVNDVAVGRDIFNREYIQTIERYQRASHEVKPALQERLKDNIVRRLVDAELIRQQADKMGVVIKDEERAAKWDEHKKRYGNDQAFQAFLARAGTSEADVRRQFENNLVREKVFARVSEGVAITQEEVKAFYEKNRARYDVPEQIRASHILLRITPNATPEEKAGKKKKASELAKRAKKEDFAKLAGEFGEDPTKNKGGDLGFFSRGKMVKPFEEAAWKLEKGEVSPVVETQFGFHIIKKTDQKAARKKPFDEVMPQIEKSLQARKRNTEIRKALQEWKEGAKIEIFVKGDQAIIQAGRVPAKGKNPRINLKGMQKGKKIDIKKLPGRIETKTKPINVQQ